MRLKELGLDRFSDEQFVQLIECLTSEIGDVRVESEKSILEVEACRNWEVKAAEKPMCSLVTRHSIEHPTS